MNVNYLFPHRFKKLGVAIFIPSVIIGLVVMVTEYSPEFLEMKIPYIYINKLLGDNSFFGFIKNGILDEILTILALCSGMLLAFSKESEEDEFIHKIRLESLVWATYVNYGILLFSILFLYEMAFFWVMVLNMFTILIFFIIRFNWQVAKLRKSARYEE